MSAATPTPPPPQVPGAAALADALGRALRGREPAALPGPGRRAAVLIVLADRGGEASLLLTKRSDDMPDPSRADLPPRRGDRARRPSRARRPLRETEEEVGLPREALRVVGELDDVHTMASGFIIRPFVALLEGRWQAVPSDAEVARAFHVPVADVLRADACCRRTGAAGAALPARRRGRVGRDRPHPRIFSRVLRCALQPRASRPATPAGADPAR